MSLHKPTGNWRLGLALSLTTVLCWGSLPIILKIILQHLDAVTLTWFRFLLSAVVLFAFLSHKRRIPAFHRAGKNSIILLIFATLGLIGNYIFYQLGLGFISANAAQLLIQSSPLMFMIASVIIFKERLGAYQVTGIIALCGGFILFFNDHLHDLFGTANDYSMGIFYIFLASVTWAIYALAQKQLLSHFISPAIMLFIYFGSAILVTPFSHPGKLLQLDGWGLTLLLYCAANTVLGYGAFSEALAHWEASRVSATLALSPIMTLGLSAITTKIWPGVLPPEHLNIMSYVGAVVVVVGAVLAALGRQVRSPIRAYGER
jgi:drug/metabolite transporter (DMT)-like permease